MDIRYAMKIGNITGNSAPSNSKVIAILVTKKKKENGAETSLGPRLAIPELPVRREC